MRWGTAVLAAAALVLLFAAAASAETRFVAKGGVDAPGCTVAASPCGTIGYAVGQANNGDTIQIGAGTFTEAVATEKVLTFSGAGGGTLDGIPANTVIRGPVAGPGYGMDALELPNGGAVSSLRAEGGDGKDEPLTSGQSAGDGLVYTSPTLEQTSLDLDHVVLVGGEGGEGKNSDPFEAGAAGRGIAVDADQATVALSAVASGFAGGAGLGAGWAVDVSGPNTTATISGSKMRAQDSQTGSALIGGDGARITLDSVDVDGPNGGVAMYEGSVTIRHSRLRGTYPVAITGTSGTTSTGEVLDSVMVSTGGPAAEAYSYDDGSTSSLQVIGSTIVSLDVAPAVRALREEGSSAATVTLRNSIARHLPPPVIPPVDLVAEGGTIDADFSSFTTTVAEAGGTISAPGSGANVVGDPLFVDPDQGDFAIRGTSPLVDRGNPALSGAGELDLAGAARSLDGNRDCLPAPDIGAYEVTGQGVECDPSPTISGFGVSNRVFAPKGGKAAKRSAMARSSALRKPVKRGTRFSYTLSEPAKISIVIERKRTKKGKRARFVKVTTLPGEKRSGKQSTPFSGRVKGKPLRPGKYRATIVATDGAGQASTAHQLTFKIVSG